MDPEAGYPLRSIQTPSTNIPKVKKVNNCPRGETKKAADFMSYDADHWVFRRFERLGLFNILCLQQELVDYETKLELMLRKEWMGLKEGEFEKLISDIRSKLKEYEDTLLSQSRHKDFQEPPEQTLSLIREHCKDEELDVFKEFALPKYADSDHVAIGNRDKTWIHRFVDQHETLRNRFAQRASEDAPSSLFFYSESAVRRAETIVLNLLFCFLLFCPIVILSFVHGKASKLGVVFCFVFAASALASDLSNAANKANMAVIAGYAAILVVALSSTIDS